MFKELSLGMLLILSTHVVFAQNYVAGVGPMTCTMVNREASKPEDGLASRLMTSRVIAWAQGYMSRANVESIRSGGGVQFKVPTWTEMNDYMTGICAYEPDLEIWQAAERIEKILRKTSEP